MEPITLNCPHCSKTFTKRTLTLARMALQMHIGRVHTKTIPTAHLPSAVRVKNFKGKQPWATKPKLGRPPKPVVTATEIVTPKRQYTKRQPVAPAPAKVEMRFNFCPNCGFNIERAAIGIVLANHKP